MTPADLTFGVEIELFMPPGRTRAELAATIAAVGVEASAEFYNHSVQPTWKIVTDGSLVDSRGAEVVSPVLQGEEGLATILRVAKAIEVWGCTVDRRCGLHVHVGVPGGRRPSYADSDGHEEQVEFLKRVVALYAKHEATIDCCLPPSRRSNRYCQSQPFTPRLRAAKVLRGLARVCRDRYCKVNVQAYWRHGTVEFRQHSGTVEGHKIVNWARFCLALAAKATEPEQPRTRVGRLANTARLRRTVTSNPKRYGSAAYRLWQLYGDGMTIAEAVAAAVATGHTEARARSDITYNVGAGLLVVEGAETAAAGLPALLAEIAAPADLASYLTARHTRFAHQEVVL